MDQLGLNLPRFGRTWLTWIPKSRQQLKKKLGLVQELQKNGIGLVQKLQKKQMKPTMRNYCGN